MKTRIAFITALCLLLAGSGTASAQTFFGLAAGERYSPEQMEAATGMKATETRLSGGQDWKLGYEMLFREGLVLKASFGGEFYYFEVTGKRLPLFGDAIDGGLRVGDDVSRIFSLREGYPKAIGDGSGKTGSYRIFTKQDDSYVVWFDRGSGKITKIHWCMAR